jgi:5-methylthioribose kinase
MGEPAFDLGVLLAHLYLSGQPASLADSIPQRYGATGETAALARGFAGAEIMRRLLGVAQLPLEADLETKSALLETSHRLVLA